MKYCKFFNGGDPRLGATLEIAAHDLPPVVALGRLHVHELNAHLPLAAMTDHRAHLQLSGWIILVNTKMNFNLRSHRVLSLAQDSNAYRAHVRQKAGHELVGRTKQNARIGGAQGAVSPFGRWIGGQMSNRNSGGPRGKACSPRDSRKVSTIC